MTTTTDSVYAVPQDLIDFRDTIRQIVRERVWPRAAEIDESGEYPRDIRRLFAEHDILALPFEEEYGGTGTGTLMQQMAVEEIARACASSALMLMVQELGTLPIRLFGSDELKQRFLPRCASGEWSPAFALSEPEAGSDPGSMRTQAVKDGDEWVIDGAKNWITNAGIADFYVVFALTDREQRRITAFVVEADRPGFAVGKLERKLGIHGSPTGSPTFDGVRVPEENVIGEVGRGMRVALGTLERTRLGAGAQAVGIAQGAIDYARDYAKERIAFGQPVIEFQNTQQARRHGDRHRRRPRAPVQGLRDGRPQRSRSRQVLLDGEALRLRQRDEGDGRGGADPRRLRLRQGVPAGADDARRQDHPDLRGHERDPTGRHRPLDALSATAPRFRLTVQQGLSGRGRRCRSRMERSMTGGI
jgi:alkylation response protein AidB-like acyl-CoA dehydrogenase